MRRMNNTNFVDILGGRRTDWFLQNQACRIPELRVARATKFCTVTPTICGSVGWNFLHIALKFPRIL